MSVQVTSTTDSAQKVTEAQGDFQVESNEPIETAQLEETQEAKAKAPTSEVVETEEHQDADDESDELDASDEAGKSKGKKKGGYQRRIDKVTKQREEAKRDAEFWRAKALEAKPAGEQKVEAKSAADTSKEPQADQFEKHEDYVKALAKWEVKQELQAEKAQQREQTVKAEQKTQLKSHIDRVVAFEKATPDFKELMEDIADVRLSPAVNNAIIDSEHGPKLMYEFAKNPAELDRINALSPEAAARAIGRLEAKFDSSAEKKVEAAAVIAEKKVTTAPKPITPLNSKAGHSNSIRDELPYDEWVKIRRNELRNG